MIIGLSGKMGSGKDTVGKMIQYFTSSFPNKSWSHFELGLKQGYVIINDESEFIDSDWQIKKYAKKLKEIASLMLGIPVEEFESQEVKDRVLGEEWKRYRMYFHNKSTVKLFLSESNAINFCSAKGNEHYSFQIEYPTIRQFLQELGTEAMRNVIHPNAWVNALFADYIQSEGNYGYEEAVASDGGYFSKRVYNPGNFPNWIITDVRFENEVEAIVKHGGVLIRINRNNWTPKAGEVVDIKVFSNWSSVTFTHEDEEGNFNGVGSDGYKYKSPLIRQYGQHLSETALDNYAFTYTIDNNGSLEDLYYKVERILMVAEII